MRRDARINQSELGLAYPEEGRPHPANLLAGRAATSRHLSILSDFNATVKKNADADEHRTDVLKHIIELIAPKITG
jgi:hypothetical protein